MMSTAQIVELSRKQAAKAARAHKKPLFYTEQDREDPIAFIRKIPNIGSYDPPGFEQVDDFMCDKSGWGAEDEPALTIRQLCKRLEPGMGYAIIEEGQFQIVMGEFARAVR